MSLDSEAFAIGLRDSSPSYAKIGRLGSLLQLFFGIGHPPPCLADPQLEAVRQLAMRSRDAVSNIKVELEQLRKLGFSERRIRAVEKLLGKVYSEKMD